MTKFLVAFLIAVSTGPAMAKTAKTSSKPLSDRTPIGMAREGILAPGCSRFMNRDGRLGDWGKILYSKMSDPKYQDSYTSSKALVKACPRFKKLNEKQKLKAWVWFYTALAHEESNCELNREHPTHVKNRDGEEKRINPTLGFGLWALEKLPEYREHRGPACADIGTYFGQADCAVDIMQRTALSANNGAVTRKSYWGPVRRYSQQLDRHMRRFTVCY